MRTFTFLGDAIRPGIRLTEDPHLGKVIFLGEEGRGRRWEKVALGRRNPAIVRDDVVTDVRPVEVTLPARGEKPKKSFWVLETPRMDTEDILVRVSTLSSYVRGARGRWETVEGSPEVLVKGYGAFGAAGRVGTWQDGLIVLHPGDTLRVYPSRGPSWALWLPSSGGEPQRAAWRDYETLQALESYGSEGSDDLIIGACECLSFADGQLTKGIAVHKGPNGPAVLLGETGRGRAAAEVPVLKAAEGPLTEAAVARLDDEHVALVESQERVPNTFLVRIDTSGPYTKGSRGEVSAWKGSPLFLSAGHGAHGLAGGAGIWDVALALLREGDVLFVLVEGGYKSCNYALHVTSGELLCEEWHPWKLRDARQDPTAAIAAECSPVEHTPNEWAGQIVSVRKLVTVQSGCGPAMVVAEEVRTGELVRVDGDIAVLDIGWAVGDHYLTDVKGEWVYLEKREAPRPKLGPEELRARACATQAAEELKDRLVILASRSKLEQADEELQRDIARLLKVSTFQTMPTERWGNLGGYDSIEAWAIGAKEALAQWTKVEADLLEVSRLAEIGEVLPNFGGKVRPRGNSRLVNYWVLDPDGDARLEDRLERNRNSRQPIERIWKLVGRNELALKWSKADSASEHVFEVVKLPVDGVSEAQICAAEAIVEEIDQQFTSFGGRPVDQGWALKPDPWKADEPSTPPENFEDALASLRAKWGR